MSRRGGSDRSFVAETSYGCQPFLSDFVHTPEDAEDALQETLWIVSRKIGTLKSASALISWLFTIVKRECYRLLRIRQKEVPLDRIPEPLDEREQGNDRQVLAEEIALAYLCVGDSTSSLS